MNSYSADVLVPVFTFLVMMTSLCPTFGGSNPGMRAELTHTVKEELSLICGYETMSRPSAFASVAVRCIPVY